MIVLSVEKFKGILLDLAMNTIKTLGIVLLRVLSFIYYFSKPYFLM